MQVLSSNRNGEPSDTQVPDHSAMIIEEDANLNYKKERTGLDAVSAFDSQEDNRVQENSIDSNILII